MINPNASVLSALADITRRQGNWEESKAYFERAVVIEDAARFLGMNATISLEPDPIPLDVKIVLFGDRMLVANATGCSSIYGGNLPTTPWSQNSAGQGPVWSNSLFEDNAEFGLGMRLAVDAQRDLAQMLVRELRGEIGEELADGLLEARGERNGRAGAALGENLQFFAARIKLTIYLASYIQQRGQLAIIDANFFHKCRRGGDLVLRRGKKFLGRVISDRILIDNPHLDPNDPFYDFLRRFGPQFTGGLRRLSQGGAMFTRGYQDHALTETAPGHSTLTSGRFPVHTGIAANAQGVNTASAPLLGGATDDETLARAREIPEQQTITGCLASARAHMKALEECSRVNPSCLKRSMRA